MFLIFLKDEADSVPNFVEGKFFKGVLIDSRDRITVLVQKVDADVLGIFDEHLFFLHKEICILGHPLIYFLSFSLVIACCFVGNDIVAHQVDVLEVLVGLLEIEELTLDVEGGHEIDIITQSYLNI